MHVFKIGPGLGSDLGNTSTNLDSIYTLVHLGIHGKGRFVMEDRNDGLILPLIYGKVYVICLMIMFISM